MTETVQGKLKVFRSSAGSGKTYTLAKEYIKLLFIHREVEKNVLSENYFRHILAITFTNDAANEMKERVLKYLREFSIWKQGDEHKLLNQIQIEIQAENPGIQLSKEQIKKRSEVILQSILHRYSDFNIQTIDSFTNQIARSFSRELGLPGNYEIYLDTDIKLSESVDILLSQIDEKEKSLLKWLFEFVRNRVDENKNWNISYNLKDFSKTLTDEKVYEHLESLKEWDLEDFDQSKKNLSKEIATLEGECKKIAAEGLDYLNSQGLDTVDLKYKKTGVKAFFKDNYESPFSKPLSKRRIEMLKKNDWLDAKSSPGIDSYDDANANISIIVAKLHAFLEENNSRFLSVKNILGNIYEMALLNKIKTILEELKRKDDQAFLSDLNEKIRNVVLNEPIPFIYEKAGVRYKHILIDEFQDTSVFQWINLIPLISNTLAEGKVNLIVGDVKQSIYRWRGADPDILVNLPETKDELKLLPIREHVATWKEMVEINPLDSNWRSKPAIVNFNNDFFDWLKNSNEQYVGLGHYYDDVKQKAEKEGDAEIKIDILNDRDFSIAEMQDLKSELVVDYVKKCAQNGYAWRDMAILCRKNSDSKRISKALIDSQISIISDESLLLDSSGPVKLLICVFEFLNEPGNQEKCADLFLAIASLKESTIKDWNEIRGNFKVKSTKEFTDFLTAYFGFEAAAELSEGTVFQLGQAWIRVLNLMKDVRQQVYLDYFLDVIYDHSNKADSGLSQFLDYWEEKKEKLSISSSKDQNAVRVLTIHRSKGLQYPIVIIPYPEFSYSRNDSKIWVEMPDNYDTELPVAILNSRKELEGTEFKDDYTKEKNAEFIEEVNALYVAMTRAEERLYIIGSAPGKNNMSKFIFDYLQSKDYKFKEFKGSSFDYTSYQIAELKKEKSGGIDKTALPWNNSEHPRIRFNRDLRWSVDFTLSKEQLNRIEAGKSFHLLMSFFKTEEDAQKVIKMASDVYSDEKDLKQFKSFIRQILSDIELKSFFQDNWRIHTEKAILYDGEFLRPDRFQVEGSKIIIIDYKTGVQDEEHKNQINKYQKGLEEIFSQHSFVKYLIYSEPFKIISVS